MARTGKRVAVIGAGPIGLEAALYAARSGFDVQVYEADSVGASLRDWGHVTLFTPWSMNASPLAVEALGLNFPAQETPTGAQMVSDYLEPLAALPELHDRIHTFHRVVTIGRGGLLKGEAILAAGDKRRTRQPFRILMDAPQGERIEEADFVIDTTGVYGQPNAMGRGGIPARGERFLGTRKFEGIPDVLNRDKNLFSGKKVLVVGGGLSAATTLRDLSKSDVAAVHWVNRGNNPPLVPMPNDPLPTREALVQDANSLAKNPPEHWTVYSRSQVLAFEINGGQVRVTLDSPDTSPFDVDLVVNQTGFRPKNALYRELQVHECYATQGPMALSAALMGSKGSDCTTQSSQGANTLKSPEPNFYILGNKSYGRSNNFLLRVGHEQIRDAFQLITGNPEHNLYKEPAAHA
ncbi:MAG: NAD(P)-binding domain-containing protein [Candidatus Eisenbacteria bacterium]|uniref:NAD(P)-binding domain-containing protein n=1 Tax=Eiseniibacteriota bacterium TaxID=2212470 RepID=A0A7Y2EAS9_UNCEI|nr:NAD(P)-binding domain-containing protein [Candidatus Eisenbacteria bacterium]